MESKLIDNVDEQVINSYIKGIINLTNKLPDYIKQNIAKLDLSPLSNQVELSLKDLELQNCQVDVIDNHNVITRVQTKTNEDINGFSFNVKSYHVKPKAGKHNATQQV